jgi:thiol:disulfide interchange protein
MVALGACKPRVDGGHGPVVPVATIKALPTPLPQPYDEEATAEVMKTRLDAAFADAGKYDKRVVVDLGGNWCVWCRALAATMDLPEVKPFIDSNFIVVPVDVTSVDGPVNRNTEVLKRLGVSGVNGFPWLVVAEANGQVLVSSDAVTDEKHQTPQQMVDWLAQYAKHRRD